jgi:hypothetical protein
VGVSFAILALSLLFVIGLVACRDLTPAVIDVEALTGLRPTVVAVRLAVTGLRPIGYLEAGLKVFLIAISQFTPY